MYIYNEDAYTHSQRKTGKTILAIELIIIPIVTVVVVVRIMVKLIKVNNSRIHTQHTHRETEITPIYIN